MDIFKDFASPLFFGLIGEEFGLVEQVAAIFMIAMMLYFLIKEKING